ncbi:MAG: flagellar protein FlaG [FCB group bacterium]|nr:flagellar protein FlaG [FCB group bacterium]
MQLKEINSTAPQEGSAADKVTRRQTTSEKMTTAETKEQSPPETTLDVDEMKKVVEYLKEFADWGNFNIGFDKEEDTNLIIVNIVDSDSGEIIKQIPPEEILRIRSQLREVAGLIFDHLA